MLKRIIHRINEIGGVVKYNYEWRQVHKDLGVDARFKVHFKAYSSNGRLESGLIEYCKCDWYFYFDEVENDYRFEMQLK